MNPNLFLFCSHSIYIFWRFIIWERKSID